MKWEKTSSGNVAAKHAWIGNCK